jgi:hypothetical protein
MILLCDFQGAMQLHCSKDMSVYVSTCISLQFQHINTTRMEVVACGARPELNSVFCLEKVDQWKPIRTSTIQSTS